VVLGTSLLRPEKYPGLPPFIQRFGFGLIFAGAGSILHSGDTENGSGVAQVCWFFVGAAWHRLIWWHFTAWTLSYLVFDKWRQPKHPRTPLTLLLSGAAASVAALYGTEYFRNRSRTVATFL
ncbi:hypothetical protein BS47DRAFT_1291738, partial [Hydnum rufescens UP504]